MGKKILLIDDDEDLVETLAESLTVEGFDIIKAYDGVQGWTMIKQREPDLIVLDALMPVKQGFEVADELEKSEYSHIPVIILTGIEDYFKDTKLTLKQILGCRANAFIKKPFDVEELIEVIRKFI